MFSDLTDRTLELINKLPAGGLNKTTLTQSTGLVAFDLRGPALQLYPVLTPLRNKIPREVTDRGDTATRWKAVTGVNTTTVIMGVQEGKRSGEMQITEQDYLASYAGLGLEASINWEADWAGGQTFDNKATVSTSLLRAVMIGEEQVILGGNASLALGTCPTPVLTGPTAGGSLTAQACVVFCVALTLEGLALAGGPANPVSASAAVLGSVTRTNIDGTTTAFGGGSSQVSAVSNAITTASSNLTIAATVAAVKGAAGYAWYVGTAAANAALVAITTVNAVTISTNGPASQKANDAAISSDHSTNSLEFDGLLTQAQKSGQGGYYASLNGAALTSDGANGIVEIDTALQTFWDTRRLSPNEIWVNSQEAKNINKKVVNAGGVPLFRFTLPAGQSGPEPVIMGGTSVAKYWNKFTQQFIDLMIHPNMPAGTIFFNTWELPYPLSGVGNTKVIRCRRDYYQIDWPIVSRQNVYGIYMDEVLVERAPFSLGVIANVLNG